MPNEIYFKVCYKFIWEADTYDYSVLARVPALRAGWGHVTCDRTFGAPTCGLKKVCDKRKNVHSKF